MTLEMQKDEVELRQLKPVIATAESLAGYGYLIAEPNGLLRDKIDFYPEVRVSQPAKFEGNDDICLNLVSFTMRALEVRWMEYHTKHTQTFIPLAGKPFYMVLGKPTARRADGGWMNEREALPDADTVQAFYFDGSGGLVMDRGTWHEVPFPAAEETHFVCICTNETNENLEAQGDDGECDGGDLTKRNIVKRMGYTFAISASS